MPLDSRARARRAAHVTAALAPPQWAPPAGAAPALNESLACRRRRDHMAVARIHMLSINECQVVFTLDYRVGFHALLVSIIHCSLVAVSRRSHFY